MSKEGNAFNLSQKDILSIRYHSQNKEAAAQAAQEAAAIKALKESSSALQKNFLTHAPKVLRVINAYIRQVEDEGLGPIMSTDAAILDPRTGLLHEEYLGYSAVTFFRPDKKGRMPWFKTMPRDFAGVTVLLQALQDGDARTVDTMLLRPSTRPRLSAVAGAFGREPMHGSEYDIFFKRITFSVVRSFDEVTHPGGSTKPDYIVKTPTGVRVDFNGNEILVNALPLTSVDDVPARIAEIEKSQDFQRLPRINNSEALDGWKVAELFG